MKTNKSSVQIRQARLQDARALSLLLDQLGYPEINETLAGEKIETHTYPDYHLLVAEEDDQVIGFIALHWFELLHSDGKIGRITAFCVDEKFRSQGVGSQLLNAAEEFLLIQGCVKFEVTSNIRRIRTHGFYLKNGYSEDSRRFIKYPNSLTSKG